MKQPTLLRLDQTNLENTVVEESTLVLTSFRRVKKAFEPFLFISVSCQTLILITMMYNAINFLRGKQVTVISIILALFNFGIYILSALTSLIYISSLADDVLASMRTLLIPLG